MSDSNPAPAGLTRQQALRLGLLAAVAVAAPARAEDMHAAHMAPAAEGEAAAGYQAANDRMHVAMDIEYTGDANIDFARGMIGHHQGAIEMATVMLEYGNDPDLRKLAEDVIHAQQAEIAFLERWLAAHPA